MHRRLLTLFAAATILLMVLPPLCNAFDTWDKKPEFPIAGRDTETSLMVFALEFGMGIAIAWSSVLLLAWLAKAFLPQSTARSLAGVRRGVRATDYLLLLFSPPPWQSVSLRI